MRIVALQLEVLERVLLDVLAVFLDLQLPLIAPRRTHRRERTRLPLDLHSQLFLVVHVHVRIADRMHEFPRLSSQPTAFPYLQSGDVRQQNRQR